MRWSCTFYLLRQKIKNKSWKSLDEQKLRRRRWSWVGVSNIRIFSPRGLKSQEWRDTSQFPLFKTPGKLKALCKIKMSSESMANQAIKSTRNLGHTYKGKSANSMKFEFSLAEWDFLSQFETLWPHAHLSSYKCEKTNTCVDMLSAPLEKYF